MSTARHVRDEPNWQGDSKVYRLDDGRHVVVTVTQTDHGPVTFMFDANDDGTLPTAGDATHSLPGAHDHADMLAFAGHQLEPGA